MKISTCTCFASTQGGYIGPCPVHDVRAAIERQQIKTPDSTARLLEYDEQVLSITQKRGVDYGPPRADFERVQAIYQALVGPDDSDLDPAVRHVFYLLAVKLARLRRAPTHLDSWIDIAGYARCGVMVTDDLLPGGTRYAGTPKPRKNY